MKKIAIFGSAFNPPSLGHRSVIESLSHFDQVLLEPSLAHAWGKEMLDYESRCELIDAFIQDLQLPNVTRSRVEPSIHQPNQSVTTFSLLEKITQQNPDCALTFVIGPDNFFNFAKFYKAEEIMKRWNVMACPEKVAIRSSDIRQALAEHRMIDKLTTHSVAQLLLDNNLYQTCGR